MYFRESRQGNLLGALALAASDRPNETLTHGERGGLSGVAALVHIRLRPGHTIELLARVLALSHSATVRLVDRLEADGLVERAPPAGHPAGETPRRPDRRSLERTTHLPPLRLPYLHPALLSRRPGGSRRRRPGRAARASDIEVGRGDA